jgi:glycosyltransferase involved in cell wall biosynthesis
VTQGRRDDPERSRDVLKIILARSNFSVSVSGADEALVRYALLLQRSGHSVSVMLLHDPPMDNPYFTRLESAGIAVDWVSTMPLAHRVMMKTWRLAIALRLTPDPTLVASPASIVKKRRLARQAWNRIWRAVSRREVARARRCFAAADADLVHLVGSDHDTLVMVPAAHGAGLPILLHELGTADHLPELRIHYDALADILPSCNEIAALSPALASGWSAFYEPARPVRVLPLSYDDTAMRGRAPSPDGIVRFGYAARLEHSKGIMFLLEAFARVHAARPAAQLVIAGIGPLAQLARARAQELGLGDCCQFVGYAPEADKPRLLASFDALVLPTLSEGTPNTVVEAMMFAIAVVACSVGGIPDMLADEAGLLVPPGDVDALAAAMLRLVDDVGLRVELGRRARQRYERLFRPDVVLDTLLHEYHRVANGPDERPARRVRGGHPWVQDDTPSPRDARVPANLSAVVGTV